MPQLRHTIESKNTSLAQFGQCSRSIRPASLSYRYGIADTRGLDRARGWLPRLIGHSRAIDLILTGRGIDGVEAERIGLANRVTAPGGALAAAVELAHELAALPQRCMRNDRLSAIEQWDLPFEEALVNEARRGRDTIASGETLAGARRFAGGAGRHGAS